MNLRNRRPVYSASAIEISVRAPSRITWYPISTHISSRSAWTRIEPISSPSERIGRCKLIFRAQSGATRWSRACAA